jgi:hypothetical protein
VVTTEGASGTLANLRRKAAAAEAMFARLVENMNEALAVARPAAPSRGMEVPQWLS